MRLTKLFSRKDEMAAPDASWHVSQYATVACSECNNIPPEHQDRGLAVVLADENEELKGPVVFVWNTNLMLLRTELVVDLQLERRGFACASVECRGERLDHYVSVVASPAIRIMTRSSMQAAVTPCVECGTPFTRVYYQDECILASDISDREVNCCMSGSTLIVTAKALSWVRPAIRRELSLRSLPVR